MVSFRDAVVRNVLRRRFADVFVSGSLDTDSSRPTIVISNHICPWDALVAYHVCRRTNHHFRMFAHPAIVARHPYMKAFGFLSIPRDDPIQASAILTQEAERLKRDPTTAMWVFATGQHTRLRVDDSTETGALALRHLVGDANFVVIALFYEFFRSTRPWAWVKVMPVPSGQKVAPSELGTLLRDAENALSSDLVDGANPYTSVLARGSSTVVIRGVPVDLLRWNHTLAKALGDGARLTVGSAANPLPLRYDGPSATPEDLARLVGRRDGKLAELLVLTGLHDGTR